MRTLALLLVVALGFAGCQKPAAPPPVAAQANPPKPEGAAKNDQGKPQMPPVAKQPAPKSGGSTGGGNSAAMDVLRGKERQVNQGYMENIGLYYHLFFNDRGRAPRTLDEFVSYWERDHPKAAKAIKDGTITIVMNAPLSSNVVIAYESEAYTNGLRLVMMGDKSIKMMNNQDFQNVLRNRE
jgi:hypothetical protein